MIPVLMPVHNGICNLTGLPHPIVHNRSESGILLGNVNRDINITSRRGVLILGVVSVEMALESGIWITHVIPWGRNIGGVCPVCNRRIHRGAYDHGRRRFAE
jgi:hypothetical protein